MYAIVQLSKRPAPPYDVKTMMGPNSVCPGVAFRYVLALPRLLLYLIACHCLAALDAQSQSIQIQPERISTVRGLTTDGIFAIQGNIEPLPNALSTDEVFTVAGSLLSISSATATFSTDLLINGSFENTLNTFIPDAYGLMSLRPGVSSGNLLPYGDAEGLPGGDGSTTVPVPGWTVDGNLSVIRWDDSGNGLKTSDPGPGVRGANYFAGGTDAGPEKSVTTATTVIELSNPPDRIDAGATVAELSGWFGGFGGQADQAALVATFLNASSTLLGTLRIGDVTPDKRHLQTGLIFDSATQTIPVGTRRIEVVLEMKRQAQIGYNDGYADNLSLVVRDEAVLIPGWTVTTAELAWVDNANTFGAGTPFGSHSLDLTGYHDGRPFAGVSQIIPTVPGQNYRLSLALGSNADYPGAGGRKSVSICAGNEAAILSFTPTNKSGNQWTNLHFNFTAESVTTAIQIQGLVSSGNYLGIDNVSVVPDAAPSPGSEGEIVENGSFEISCPVNFNPDGNGLMSIVTGQSLIPGWTALGEVVWGINGNAFGPTAADGDLFIDLTGYHDSQPYGGVEQWLATIPNENYQLSFALGSDQDVAAYRGPVGILVSAGTTSNVFRFTPIDSGNQWKTFTMNFNAESESTHLVLFGFESAGGGYIGLDQVSVRLTSSSSSLRLTDIMYLNGGMQFSYPWTEGHQYILEVRSNLDAGTWEPFQTAVFSGEGPKRQVRVSALSEPKQFFRLRSLP